MLQRTTNAPRTVESEGILRMFLLALAILMPIATAVYMNIQTKRLSYEMADVRDRIHKEEEFQRKLMLERSRFQRDDEVQAYAEKAGLQPRKQSYLIRRTFTSEDQRVAKLRPVSSDEIIRR